MENHDTFFLIKQFGPVRIPEKGSHLSVKEHMSEYIRKEDRSSSAGETLDKIQNHDRFCRGEGEGASEKEPDIFCAKSIEQGW